MKEIASPKPAQPKNVDRVPVAKNGLSYSEILGQIGQELKKRQGLIAKRVAVISLPLIISASLLIYAGKIGDRYGFSDGTVTAIAIAGFASLLLTFPWALILGQVFKTERIIWIDSFFDEVVLDSKQSWKMAKKLFWPSVWLDILVFLKYYVPVLVLSLGIIAGYFVLIATDVLDFQVGLFVLMLITLPILVMIYSYFVKVRLRYVPFLLVDTYGSDSFSYRALFKDSKELNRVMKSEALKKMLVVVLGAEVAENAVNTVIGVMSGLAHRAGDASGVVGAAAGQYASEVVAVNRSYAQQVVFYIYYRLAREVHFGAAQVKNDTLYRTAVKER